MYFILVSPGHTRLAEQPLTKDHAVHLQHLCQQEHSAFLLIFETIGEAEAFESLKESSFLMQQATQEDFASLAGSL